MHIDVGVGGRETFLGRQQQHHLGDGLLGQLVLVTSTMIRSNNLGKDRVKPVVVVHNPLTMQVDGYLGKDGVKPCCWPSTTLSMSRKTVVWNETSTRIVHRCATCHIENVERKSERESHTWKTLKVPDWILGGWGNS